MSVAHKMSKIQVNEYGDLLIDDHNIFRDYYQSKNQNYIVAFRSSQGMEKQDGSKIEIPGKLYLIENKSKILWEKEFIKLNSLSKAFVSDNGRVILCSNKEYSLFSKESEEVFRYKFNSNISGSEFYEKNSILIITTASPEDKIYCFKVNETKLLWVKNNQSRFLIHVIEFLDNNTIYLSANRYEEDSYCIDLDGNLIVGSVKENEISKRNRLNNAAQLKFNNKQYAEAESLFLQAYIITDKYMFSWDDILGTYSDRLLKILNKIMGLDYTQTTGTAASHQLAWQEQLKEMIIMNLNEILKIEESSTIEFKELVNDSVFKSLSAFSNTNGGLLYIGISDKKEVLGFDCSNRSIEGMTSRIINKLGIHPQIDCIEVNGKHVLKVEVKKKHSADLV